MLNVLTVESASDPTSVSAPKLTEVHNASMQSIVAQQRRSDSTAKSAVKELTLK